MLNSNQSLICNNCDETKRDSNNREQNLGPRQELLSSIKFNQLCCDPLFIGFRSYITCQALERFRLKGLTKKMLDKLQKKMDIVYPWNDEYELVRQDVNRRFNKFPLMIIMCESSKDVQKAFCFATKYNFEFCIRSGGHSYEGYSVCSGIVIDQSRRSRVKVDKKDNIVKIESGALLGPIASKLSRYNLALPSGTCANNGLGLILGGGQGFLSRSYGLTCDSLISLEMVLASGDLVKVDKNNYPDLLWASQGGGGGNFGIVTSFELQVYPIKKVIIFDIVYSFDLFKPVFKLWQEFAPFTDERLSSEMDLRSNQHAEPVLFTGLFLGSKKELVSLIQPFLLIGNPKILIQEVSYLESAQHFTGKTVAPPFFKNKSSVIYQSLPDEAIDIMMNYMTKTDLNDKIGYYSLGGKVSSLSPTATAFVHRKAHYWIQYASFWNEQEQGPIKIARVTELYTSLLPYVGPFGYVNIIDRDIPNYLYAYYGENIERLVHIKKTYDPTNLFAFPQSIPV